MNILAALVSALIGFVAGYVLRPRLERRRRLRQLLAAAASQRRDDGPDIATQSEHVLPRDFYLGTREGHAAPAPRPAPRRTLPVVNDAGIPMPRDYYDREGPEDGGTLSEGYGLRQYSAPSSDSN